MFEFAKPALPVLIALCLPMPVQAACIPITKVPVEITKTGTYCLTDSLTDIRGFGRAIQISANHVTIDFQGYSLIGNHGSDAPPPNSAISATNQRYITIKNGTIRGFDGGIFWLCHH
jgi:hypothetical protein